MFSIVSEIIPATALISEENEEIKRLYPGHRMTDLRRLTFWKTSFKSSADVAIADPDSCLGYAILKQDSVPGRKDCWHVFEAVTWPTKYAYSYVPWINPI